MQFIERKLSQALLEAARYFPAIVLAGPRQTGKTTLLKRLFPQYQYVSLDRPALAEQAEEDPEAFLSKYPAPLLIDEVQYAPKLFRFLKIKIDAARDLKGQYVLTGSQKFTLMKGVSESLAGRVAVFDFEGLSITELQSKYTFTSSPESFVEFFARGGFPELWVDMNRPIELYLNSYIATYLERDVKQVLAVTSLRDFERFLRACALRSGQQLNKSDLARDVGVSVPTVGEWLSVLEALGQIYLLEPWFGNLNKRLTKAPKLYLADPALMIHLSGIQASAVDQSPLIGAVWETFVYSELRKQLSFGSGPRKLWYYRDHTQYEADFVLEHGHELTLYECKWTSEPQNAMASNLQKIEDIFAEKSEIFRVTQKNLVTRSELCVSKNGLSFCSVFEGLIQNSTIENLPPGK